MSYSFSEAKLIVDPSVNYYIEGPNGKVYSCNWVQYEQAKAFGYVHRILTSTQAILHKPWRK